MTGPASTRNRSALRRTCIALAGVVLIITTAGPTHVVAPATVRPLLLAQPDSTTSLGLSPADIASAYDLTGGTPGTVGIVDAYSDPDLEQDLATYRSTYGLAACSAATGCLTVVGQNGTSTLPSPNSTWALETSLDLDAASAACPGCRLLVVEADGADTTDLGTAVNTAVALGATGISLSWGSTETSSATSDAAAYYTHTGVPILAAAGDAGHTTASEPADMPDVIAVGGTTLTAIGVNASTAEAGHLIHPSVTPTTTTAIAKAEARVAAAVRALNAAQRALANVQQRHTAATRAHAHAHTAATRRATKTELDAAATALHNAQRATARARAVLTAAKHQLAKIRASSTSGGGATAPTPTPTAVPSPTKSAPSSPAANQASRTGWYETAWGDGGSGCSTYINRPAWQTDSDCTGRTVADIAADADPATGLAVYDTYGTSPVTSIGWFTAGGTSLATPLITGMLVRSGHAANYSDASPLYAHSTRFWDITSGSNGNCEDTLCTAGAGYDGPTGVGSPQSLASF